MKGDYLKAKEISQSTRDKVMKRQNGHSPSGRILMPGFTEYHHFVERSSGGIGYEWNIVALTSDEHRELHDGVKVGRFPNHDFKTIMRNHLILNYENWSEENCKYKKFKKEKDYGVVRRTIR